MAYQIVDITQDGYYLHCERNWLVIEKGQQEVGKVFLGDVLCILAHTRHAVYSHDLLLKISEKNIPLVICDHRHEPVSILTPVSANHQQSRRTYAQAKISQPLQKRLWREIICKKIHEQANSLVAHNPTEAIAMKKMKAIVLAGDTTNVEARAARFYWPILFSKDFRRDRNQCGINAHLNYGYTILRSAMAQSVVAAGLIPSLGVGHKNARNSFCLVDDLVEPFRPLVDRLVKENAANWSDDLSTAARQELAGILSHQIVTEEGRTDLNRVLAILVTSLCKIFEDGKGKLEFPKEIVFV